ncbi:response regulator [Tenacibaculum geojense]|uniref:Response regulator n=1 Tax=Tenacibaculum geojense TaxID=915352 RepID=A0ABW3JRA0_9FLAO
MKKKSSILIYEDDIDLTLQWRKALEEKGFYVDITSDFKEAMNLCLFCEYDLIICDIFIKNEDGNYNGIGGITFLNFLKKRDVKRLNWVKNAPIIIVSGSLSAKKNNGSYYTNKFDINETLIKPFTTSYLLEKVNYYINKTN